MSAPDRNRSLSPKPSPKPESTSPSNPTSKQPTSPPRKRTTLKGFKWKDKTARNTRDDERDDSGRLERGYRDRSPRRDRERERERERDGFGGRRDGGGRDRNDDYYGRRREDGYGERRREGERRGDAASFSKPATNKPTTTKSSKPSKPTAPLSSTPMILVSVNDRLGTKAQIPCLASDSIKAFKAVVAAHIGRQPHEIMLKRQGERPFKDQLTLEDYGVSNGVQLDLEIDTGD